MNQGDSRTQSVEPGTGHQAGQQEEPAGGGAAQSPAIPPAAQGQIDRIKDAAKKDLSNPDHPMIRLRSQLTTANFGPGEVRTIASTKANPLSVQDHVAMDKQHSRLAASLQLAGRTQEAQAQKAAAGYHRELATKKQTAANPPATEESRQIPSPRNVKFKIAARRPEHVNNLLKDFFGQNKPPEILAMMVNAQDGMQTDLDAQSVYLDPNDPRKKSYALECSTNDPARGYHAMRQLYRDADGRLVMHNDDFAIDNETWNGSPNPLKGQGARIFEEQVNSLQMAGVDRIETLAAGDASDPTYNGYYTWARFGYDGRIIDDVMDAMSSEMRQAMKGKNNVQSLMALPGGKEFWKKHGSTFAGKFDLKEGSESLKIMRAYMEERKQRKAVGNARQ